MTLPAVIRIFFAIDIPLSVKEEIAKFIVALKSRAKTNAIRWSRPENLHITLQFLAEFRTEDLPTIIEQVQLGLKEMKPLSINFGDVQLFPNPYRPRVIVLEVKEQGELSLLAQKIGESIQSSNYSIEARTFRAHLTLGRIKHVRAAPWEFLTSCHAPSFNQIEINEVILFRSEPQHNHSVYTPLAHTPLANI